MKELTSQRILVVDDDEPGRKATTRMILKMAYPCDAVSSGEEALEKLQREHFDIVLSDIKMEGMTGLELMKRAKQRFSQLDFIIMTGYTSEYSYTDIIKAGAIDYLAKPFERAELEARLERAIKERCLLCQLKESEESLMRKTTDLETAQEQLLKKHEDLNTLFMQVEIAKREWEATMDCMGDMVILTDHGGNIQRCNRAFKEFTGKSYQEILGKKWQDLFHEHEIWIGTRERKSIELYHKPTARWFVVNHYPFENVVGDLVEGTVISFNDTTGLKQITHELEHKNKEIEKNRRELEKAYAELKATQATIVQQEKMASVGQLAAGVAHEINNPTGFVSSNLRTLSDYQDDISTLIKQYRRLAADLKETMATAEYPMPISEQLKRIAGLEAEVDIDFVLNDMSDLVKESREGTARIKKIVLDLKDFAHPGEDKPNFADINKGLDSTLNVVWNELKYKATVTKDYGDLPEVRCYPQQLNQVFVNILVNAARAIEKQGEIKITTGALDGKVEINISDTGKGIPEESLSKIFDPFFTTNEVGKGTGLGLNVAYNIIKKHKGTIDVKSTVGVGTTFTIMIPTG